MERALQPLSIVNKDRVDGIEVLEAAASADKFIPRLDELDVEQRFDAM